MKKLLLIAAILAIGSTAYGVAEGVSVNNLFVSEQDTMYTGITVKSNADSGSAGGFGVEKDITSGYNAVQNNRAVNIFRDKGPGWEDIAATHILLDVLEPIKIESEIDNLYIEAVKGDELQIEDIGFRVKGKGTARIEFMFTGQLFNEVPIGTSYATIKGHSTGLFHPVRTASFGVGLMQTAKVVSLSGGPQELEVDLHLDLRQITPGYKHAIVTAKVRYE